MSNKITITYTDTTFVLPAAHLLAVNQFRSTEETQYYLSGVFLDGPRQSLVATDGHILGKIDVAAYAEGLPSIVGAPTVHVPETMHVIARFNPQEKAFKAKCGALMVYGDTATGLLQMFDASKLDAERAPVERLGVCEFLEIDGTFPDWPRVVPREEQQDPGAHHVGIDLDKLKPFMAAQKSLAAGAVAKLVPGPNTADPILVKFPARDEFTGVLAPHRV